VSGIVLGLAWLLIGAGLCPVSAAASPFEWRGVVQGQYGRQFSTPERRRLLRFMARYGFNAYVHAPKGDPYQRTLWRDPYPPQLQAVFDREVRLASRLGIEWIANVSPAAAAYASPGDAPLPGTTPSAPICFSSNTDLDQLLAKLGPFLRAGSHTVMVSFDDVQWKFSCNADTVAYGQGERAFGAANADLLDRLYARLLALDPNAHLLTVGATYHGTADSEYLQGLRARLAAGIEVMWTGDSIESRPFSTADADAYAQLIGRAPIVWENWTNTDALTEPGSDPTRIFLGPYARPPDVVGHVRGFFFNPANRADLNFLPLGTAGNWMRRPAKYRPRRSFLNGIRSLAGAQAPALRAFAETSYSSSLRGREAPTLTRLIRRALAADKTHGARERALAKLRGELRLAVTARWHLRRVPRLRHFVSQAQPYLRSARVNARAALIATDLLEAHDAGQRRDLRHRLKRAVRRARNSPVETFGTREGSEDLAGNLIESYVARVRSRDRRWRAWNMHHPDHRHPPDHH
jgi:hyaluronoglucosaminidase